MSQPRERPVLCRGCRRLIGAVSAWCDDCHPHDGACDQCGVEVERRYRVIVPAGEWANDELRFCSVCFEATRQVAV